eukprot:GHVN01018893.1.p1 GENE.GHVN01018893.1~~GHVN01018893.1.p1  ORF type:complete len:212 (+),score=17.09 GHVN01018893.1:70-636(+)
MHMGYRKVSKLQAALEIVCLLYLLAEKTKDKVSVVIFTDEMKVLPLASGHEGIVLLISQLSKMGVLKDNGKVNLEFDLSNRFDEKKKLNLLKSFVARGKQVIYLTDLDGIKNVETINKLIVRPNMHCFKIESPVDSQASLPFSIFGIQNNQKVTVDINTLRKSKLEKGRFKVINVKERYLENFVREML